MQLNINDLQHDRCWTQTFAWSHSAPLLWVLTVLLSPVRSWLQSQKLRSVESKAAQGAGEGSATKQEPMTLCKKSSQVLASSQAMWELPSRDGLISFSVPTAPSSQSSYCVTPHAGRSWASSSSQVLTHQVLSIQYWYVVFNSFFSSPFPSIHGLC